MSSQNARKSLDTALFGKRVHSLGAISVKYEGADELVVTRVPDVSTGGMFINTAREFPDGAVLDLRFRLENTGAEVQTRGEVRYCLPGVGVGVEFIGMAEAALRAILAEIQCSSQAKPRKRRKHRSLRRR